jgi:hypothetical protein
VTSFAKMITLNQIHQPISALTGVMQNVLIQSASPILLMTICLTSSKVTASEHFGGSLAQPSKTSVNAIRE